MMASYPVRLGLPSLSLFKFPPASDPPFLPPPPAGTNAFSPPFDIPESWYHAVLDPKVPITIAAVYAVSAKLLNIYNRKNNKRPWAISKTRAFNAFVIAHNIFLAVYSAWTFWGMFGALNRTVVSPFAPTGLAGFADSMCRLSGQLAWVTLLLSASRAASGRLTRPILLCPPADSP